MKRPLGSLFISIAVPVNPVLCLSECQRLPGLSTYSSVPCPNLSILFLGFMGRHTR